MSNIISEEDLQKMDTEQKWRAVFNVLFWAVGERDAFNICRILRSIIEEKR